MASLLPSLLETQAPQRFYGRSTLPSETKKRSSESVWDSWRKVTWEVQGLWIWMNINEDEWNMKECGSLALWNYDMTLYMASEKSTAMGRDESLQSQRNRPSKRPGLKRQVICKSYQQMYVHDLISISLWFCLYVTSGAYQWLVKNSIEIVRPHRWTFKKHPSKLSSCTTNYQAKSTRLIRWAHGLCVLYPHLPPLNCQPHQFHQLWHSLPDLRFGCFRK